MAVFAIAMLLGVALIGLVPEADIEGSDGSEKYTGTAKDDVFAAKGGNDLVIGLDGDDSLTGDAGADWLIGHNGSDSLIGGDGDDVLIGGADQDILIGGRGNDFVESANILDEEALSSSLTEANSFSDIVVNYQLPASSDAGDTINLGAGDDTAVIGSGDTLTSGSGSDHISLGDWVEEGKPAIIEDFETQKDLLVFTYQSDTPEPELSLHYDPQTQITELRADGKVMAELQNSLGDITLDDVRLSRYTA